MSRGVSVNKFISQTGICSRREADEWIRKGRVKINNQVAKLGNRVMEGDEVRLDGNILSQQEKDIYIILNKPRGIICTTDLREPKNIISFMDHPERIFPVGRLDKASEGLILLTNNGDIVNKILRAGNNHDKVYIVTVNKPLDQSFKANMEKGVPILGTITKPCKVEILSKRKFKITLIQGLNRQIRRMCEHLGYEVKQLKRTRIMHLRLGKLPIGAWRSLTKHETKSLIDKLQYSK